MKHITKIIGGFSLLFVSLFFIISCEENNSETEMQHQEVTARFTRTQDGKTITFINISENATSYLWGFGDGTTSTLINPEKTYVSGTYSVTLQAFDDNGESSFFEDNIIIEGCTDETNENLNPASGSLNFTFFNAGGEATWDAFGNIGGGIVTNPKLDAVNASCNVYRYDKIAGCELWSGAGYVLDAPINFAATDRKIFKLKVFAATQITEVTLLLEFQPFPSNNPFQQRVASITKVGEWQELTFDFSDLNSGTFENIVIYFERNAPCDGDVYYFDDLVQQ